MALSTTIPAQDCVPYCDTVRTVSDEDFLDYLIDALSTASGTAVSAITSAQIQTAVDDAICDMEERANSPVSPEHKMGIALALLSLL